MSFIFFYNHNIVDVSREIDIVVDNKPIGDVLHEIFDGYDVKYIVYDRQIILSKKSDPDIRDSQQQRVVTGTVIDENGSPLPGVNIRIEGTILGVISDIDGKYTLSIPNGNSVLIFSFVGYADQKVPVAGKNIIDVSLVPLLESLDEVVVIGYGTQRKETLTGAITKIDSKIFENKGIVANPAAVLQGQVAGVIVTRNSAAPGQEGWNFEIRGASSVNVPTHS